MFSLHMFILVCILFNNKIKARNGCRVKKENLFPPVLAIILHVYGHEPLD